jgi:GNAT superfamily N-acetyltransferase
MIPKLQEYTQLALPEGFTVRGGSLDDVEACLKMGNLWSQTVIGQDELVSVEDLRQDWMSPGFDPTDDVRLVYAPDGTLVGYVEAWATAVPPVHPWLWGRVHPDYNGLGIGTAMLTWAEGRVSRVLETLDPDLRFAPRVGVFHQASESQKLFRDMGYQHIRSAYTMLIEMDTPGTSPAWPPGVSLRPFDPERHLDVVYQADMEAFRDHFGFVEEPYEEGLKRYKYFLIESESFDPSLWFIAWEGDLVTGLCICRPTAYDDPDAGHVNILAVRRPWRKRGLGLAFLHHAFNEFYNRGIRKVNLGVDAENLTGALRLYEKAGMHVHKQSDLFEKEIRPGREISVQSLEQ